MSRLRVLIVCPFLFAAVSIFAASSADAYEIGWFVVQHLTYETGKPIDHLSFDIRDDSGNPIPGGDLVTRVKLYDPSDNLVSLSGLTFHQDVDYCYGGFDVGTGCWDLNYWCQFWNGYTATISSGLKQGTYRLEVKTNDDEEHQKTYIFNQQLELPIVSSRSFQIHSDSDGNVFWSWDIPVQLLKIAETHSTSLRPQVKVYDNQQLKTILYPEVPTHMNMLFIPNNIVQELMNQGNKFEFVLQIRTNDHNCRSYSNPRVLFDMLATVIKKKQVVVIPMFE